MVVFKKIKLTLRQRLFVFLLALFLIVVSVFVLVGKDRLGLNLFTRLFTYDNEKTSATFSHGSRSENLFANLDYRLLSCTDTSLQLFSPTGETIFKQTATLPSPALSSNGQRAVVYDVGGQHLYVVNGKKMLTPVTLSTGQYILSATINQNGWMAVTTKEEGYKGVVTVYNPSYEVVLSIRLSSIYLTNALVTPDCKGVYILSPGQSNGIFESRLLYYDFKQAEAPKFQISLGDNVALSMKASGNRCWVLGDNALSLLLSSGELSAKYAFEGKYLKRASLDGNEFATLLLSDSPSGNSGNLVTVDAEGVIIGSVSMNEQVLALSAAGRYVAVLTPGSLRIYTKDLTEIYASDEMQGVQNLVLYPDGNVTLITDDLAKLHLK